LENQFQEKEVKELNIITVQPDTAMFQWTVAVQLYNAKKLGLLKYFQVLIFKSKNADDQSFNGRWKFLENKFPEAKFFYYKDTEDVSRIIDAIEYVPLLRPWTLIQHWKAFPELKDKAIFYIDSDVVFTKYPDFLFKYKDDDVNYISPAGSYTNASYFKSKRKDVVLSEVSKYDEIDVLDKVAGYCGIDRKTCEKYDDKTGAAQYLLKNIDTEFWNDVLSSCVKIKAYLADINKRFFPSENAGFQSWCSDIWATVWNLWKRKVPVETPDDMKFSWASEDANKWKEHSLYHDANATSDTLTKGDKVYKTFFKRGNKIKIGPIETYDYMLSYENPLLKTPFDDDLSYVSSELCSYNYTQIIKETKEYLFK